MVINFSKFLFLFFCLMFSSEAYSWEKTSPIKIQLEKQELGLKLSIPDGWKVYAHQIGDTGSAFKINFDQSKNLQSYQIHWPQYQTLNEQIGQHSLQTFYYQGDVFIPISLMPIDTDQPIELKIAVEYGACQQYCVLEFAEFEASIVNNKPIESVFKFLLLAFIGGFILNFMPCVLPVLSLKVFGLVKHLGQSRKIFISNLLATAAGILLSFMILAFVTIILKMSGETVGWGFHFQEPAFIMFLVIILAFFSLNLWGQFEIDLPNWLSDKFSKYSHYGLNNSFIAGAFATLLATPCTAPFLTTSVAFALAQGSKEIVAIFLFIGLGMSSPYLILAAFPQSFKLFPKPGKWMVVFKKVLSLFLFATLLWLLFVLSHQIALKSLVIFIGIIILIKFILTRSLKYKLKMSILFALVVMSFIMPLSVDRDADREKQIIADAWEQFNEDKLQQYIKNGKIVFVDFTADWCLTCKSNKFFVLDHVDLINKLKEHKVVLLRADMTNRNENYVDFLRKRRCMGIPYNVIFGPKYPNGIELPTVLSRKEIINAIKQQER